MHCIYIIKIMVYIFAAHLNSYSLALSIITMSIIYQMHGTYIIKIMVYICCRSSKQLFCWLYQLLLCLFSLCLVCNSSFGSQATKPQ
jgi:hypothetical protein